MKIIPVQPIYKLAQKPRQGPLRTQTGAGKHRNKKLEQKNGETKHRFHVEHIKIWTLKFL